MENLIIDKPSFHPYTHKEMNIPYSKQYQLKAVPPKDEETALAEGHHCWLWPYTGVLISLCVSRYLYTFCMLWM